VADEKYTAVLEVMRQIYVFVSQLYRSRETDADMGTTLLKWASDRSHER